MKIWVLIGIILMLSGCATCRNHPVACGVGVALVAGSIAASAQHHHDQHEQQPKYPCIPTSGIIGVCAK